MTWDVLWPRCVLHATLSYLLYNGGANIGSFVSVQILGQRQGKLEASRKSLNRIILIAIIVIII